MRIIETKNDALKGEGGRKHQHSSREARSGSAGRRSPANDHSMVPSKRVIGMLAILFVLWLALSGYFEGLLISFGIVSCLLVAWIRVRMDRTDGEHHFGTMRPLAAVRYLGWLTVEIIKSNLDVSRRILTPDLPISPTIVWVPAGQKTEIGRVTFATSITLTPGTVSIDVTENEIEVHALNREAAEELLRGEMSRRICDIEGSG